MYLNLFKNLVKNVIHNTYKTYYYLYNYKRVIGTSYYPRPLLNFRLLRNIVILTRHIYNIHIMRHIG